MNQENGKSVFLIFKSLQSICLFWSPLGMNNTSLSLHENHESFAWMASSNIEFNGLMPEELGDKEKERAGQRV